MDDVLIKMMIVGDANTGKSSLLLRISDDTFTESYISTIGVDFKILRKTRHDRNYKAQLWDTAGQERFRTITNAYYRGSHACWLCFSVTDRSSFESLEYFFNSILTHSPHSVHNSIVIACKCDLESKREVSDAEAKRWCVERGLRYFTTSSKKGEGHNVLFDAVIDAVNHEHWDEIARDIAEISRDKAIPIRTLIDLQSKRELLNPDGIPIVITDKICRYCAWLPNYLNEILDSTELSKVELRKHAKICVEKSMAQLDFAREMNAISEEKIEEIVQVEDAKAEAQRLALEELAREQELYKSDPLAVHSLTYDTLKERVVLLKQLLSTAIGSQDWSKLDDSEVALVRQIGKL